MWSIVNKEYRQRARGVATVGLIITYTLILSGVAFFVYLASYGMLQNKSTSAGEVGRSMCIATFITQMIMALMLSLSLNASSIAAEKDQETFDLLNLTLFRSWEIVLGKFLSSTGFLFVLVVTAVPIYTLAFSFGSMELDFFWRLATVVVGTTLFISATGLLMSLISEDLRTALGRSFLVMILLGAVTGIMGGLLVSSFDTTPPNVVSYWLGSISILVNPLWSAIDVFDPLKDGLMWTKPWPKFVEWVLDNGLWICCAAVQIAITAGILTVTALIYPRYRASKAGGVVG